MTYVAIPPKRNYLQLFAVKLLNVLKDAPDNLSEKPISGFERKEWTCRRTLFGEHYMKKALIHVTAPDSSYSQSNINDDA